MSYTPNTWKSGDVVTSAKLNNIEQGIANAGALLVTATWDDNGCTLDKTWQEIHDAAPSVLIYGCDDVEESTYCYIFCMVATIKPIGGGADKYVVKAYDYVESATMTFESASSGGYPIYTGD